MLMWALEVIDCRAGFDDFESEVECLSSTRRADFDSEVRCVGPSCVNQPWRVGSSQRRKFRGFL